MTRGYFGIGIYGSKTPDNLGTLWRSAHAMGASFIYTIGRRWPGDRLDTSKAPRHVPYYHYHDLPAFMGFAKPQGARLIIVETKVTEYTPTPLPRYKHPERALYLLGAEDRGIPKEFVKERVEVQSDRADLVAIPTTYCINVAIAGSIVMYDRLAQDE